MRILPKKPGALGVPLLCSQRPIQSHVDFTAQPPQQCLSQKAIVQVKQCTPFHVLIFSLLIHSSPSSQSVFSTEFIVQSCRCAGLSVDQLQDVPGVRRWQFCLNTRGAWLLGPLGSVCILWFNKQQQSLPRWLCHFSSHSKEGRSPQSHTLASIWPLYWKGAASAALMAFPAGAWCRVSPDAHLLSW